MHQTLPTQGAKKGLWKLDFRMLYFANMDGSMMEW